jgi:hypothetical protein
LPLEKEKPVCNWNTADVETWLEDNSIPQEIIHIVTDANRGVLRSGRYLLNATKKDVENSLSNGRGAYSAAPVLDIRVLVKAMLDIQESTKQCKGYVRSTGR